MGRFDVGGLNCEGNHTLSTSKSLSFFSLTSNDSYRICILLQ